MKVTNKISRNDTLFFNLILENASSMLIFNKMEQSENKLNLMEVGLRLGNNYLKELIIYNFLKKKEGLDIIKRCKISNEELFDILIKSDIEEDFMKVVLENFSFDSNFIINDLNKSKILRNNNEIRNYLNIIENLEINKKIDKLVFFKKFLSLNLTQIEIIMKKIRPNSLKFNKDELCELIESGVSSDILNYLFKSNKDLLKDDEVIKYILREYYSSKTIISILDNPDFKTSEPYFLKKYLSNRIEKNDKEILIFLLSKFDFESLSESQKILLITSFYSNAAELWTKLLLENMIVTESIMKNIDGDKLRKLIKSKLKKQNK